MMKKQLLAALVGGLILFVWQFLSWGMMLVHADAFRYTPNQDSLLAALEQHLGEEGNYMLPNVAPETPPEDHQRLMEGYIGKPWATISYHKSMDMSMGMNMFRGFAIDLIAVFLLTWLLLKFAQLNFSTCLKASLAVGFIGYLTINYLNSIWFESGSIGHLIDAVVQWGLVGAWLGWWLNRP